MDKILELLTKDKILGLSIIVANGGVIAGNAQLHKIQTSIAVAVERQENNAKEIKRVESDLKKSDEKLDKKIDNNTKHILDLIKKR